MTEHPLPRFLERLAELQSRRPWLLVLVAVLSLVPAAWATMRLGFKADFAELLPDNKDSVIEMRRVSSRLAGASTLTITAEVEGGKNPDALKKLVDALLPKLRALGPDWVGAVDYGTQDSRQFFKDHELLFAKLEDLQKAHDDIVGRYDYEVAKRTGELLDEDEAPPPITADEIKKRLGVDERKKEDAKEDLTGGYYMNPEGSFIAVLVRTPVSGKAKTDELRRKVEGVVADVNPPGFDPKIEVHYTGDIITSSEDYNAIVRDLGEVGAWGVAGVLLSVLLFFWRIRTVLTMGATILVALLWTFGLTRFTIGYLNTSTGFLVSIIAGNGINYGIMYMARYVEARRDEGKDVETATKLAHRDTWIPTLASAATATLAYGSCAFTDFRGFKHFGIIGGYGMILCWTVTYLFLPAIFAASEKVWPAYKTRPENSSMPKKQAHGFYGVVFARLATVAPRTLSFIGVVVGAASVLLAALFFLRDPMEYDMSTVRNERKDRTAAGELSKRVDQIVGRIGQDGMAVMTDRLDQVKPLVAELDKRWAAAPADLKPFEKVVSIYSLLPTDQEKKVPLIEEMRDRLRRARTRGFIKDEDWKEIDPHMPKGVVKPLGIDDLPEQVARAFTEKDGSRGKIVYIVPTSGFSVWDAHYLMRFADSFRYTKLPNGEVIKGSGRSVIFADMILSVIEDAPKAIAVSAFGSILVILVAFRGHRLSWAVFLPWLVGVASLCAFLFLKKIHLNFLNFVALPITIGIGAEYAHNLVQRYRVEGGARIAHVVRETGGAVITCSLTTTIGYLALMLSINHGIVSFGLAAAAGEVTCVLAAVLFLPAFLVWLYNRKVIRDSIIDQGERSAR